MMERFFEITRDILLHAQDVAADALQQISDPERAGLVLYVTNPESRFREAYMRLLGEMGPIELRFFADRARKNADALRAAQLAERSGTIDQVEGSGAEKKGIRAGAVRANGCIVSVDGADPRWNEAVALAIAVDAGRLTVLQARLTGNDHFETLLRSAGMRC